MINVLIWDTMPIFHYVSGFLWQVSYLTKTALGNMTGPLVRFQHWNDHATVRAGRRIQPLVLSQSGLELCFKDMAFDHSSSHGTQTHQWKLKITMLTGKTYPMGYPASEIARVRGTSRVGVLLLLFAAKVAQRTSNLGLRVKRSRRPWACQSQHSLKNGELPNRVTKEIVVNLPVENIRAYARNYQS